MTEDQLFEIAKIIDNEYRGCRSTFTATRKVGYWYLSTNKCDWAFLIKVFETNNKISSIKVIGDQTDGWDDIQPATWSRIEKYLNSLNTTAPATVTGE